LHSVCAFGGPSNRSCAEFLYFCRGRMSGIHPCDDMQGPGMGLNPEFPAFPPSCWQTRLIRNTFHRRNNRFPVTGPPGTFHPGRAANPPFEPDVAGPWWERRWRFRRSPRSWRQRRGRVAVDKRTRAPPVSFDTLWTAGDLRLGVDCPLYPDLGRAIRLFGTLGERK